MKHAALLVALVLVAVLLGFSATYFLVPQSPQAPIAAGITTDQVRRVLGDEIGTASDAIQIEVEGRRVRLGGNVASGEIRDRALRAVRAMQGVAEVDDRISVAPAAGALCRLRWRA